jgi:peptide deformylase
MHEDLKIIFWPDPRLKQASRPVEHFDENLRALAARMFELMRQDRGVGLAAPQVGQNIRMFIMNHTGNPEDDRVYVNPELSDAAGEEEGEEGCLSLPNIHTRIWRAKDVRMRAQDLSGQPIAEVESGYIPRIWQHETDHLNGILILDRMGPVAKLASRRILKDLEERYAEEHPEAPPAKKPKKHSIK